jgi:hypothetical protein
MQPEHFIGEATCDTDGPDWGPLQHLIGEELCPQLMWMFAVELVDGTRLQVYKHRRTRRYFHLSDDGRAFTYTGNKNYLEVDQCTAIVGVFEGWEGCSPTESERGALVEAVRNARPTLA